MAVVKINYLIKSILVFIFVSFFILNILNRDLSNDLTTIQKNSSYSVVITGGSNVMYGLNAKKIEDNFGDAVNLSLPSEGVVFNNYIAWLTKLNVKTHTVIYSPISFWDVKESDAKDPSLRQRIQELFPKISLLRYLTTVFSNNSFYPRKNSNGDLDQFKCSNDIFEWKATDGYIKRALLASNHFKQRMAAIRRATNAEIVILRIPPLFVSAIDKNMYEPRIQEVIASYQSQGMLILQERVVLSTDKTFFCEHAHHPSDTGRAFFTQNFIDALKKIRQPP